MLLDHGADIHDDDVSDNTATCIINGLKKAPLKHAPHADTHTAL